ncbi:hypothetical protein BU26DRAFT_520627 [Trematosphaeria pertusa]|uniref:RING-type domain-containing protein n=1 Tax=Trematosphaeria pertusa TaxID=390896 RepID=A0A6A6IA77_9PLEO|nr:uncharacterized protein BU26DRAFT_520627 [Trematosphaeria pertusa]KAF2247484.1 hypothetical protein BU26DRAFT_520627 [Trematosphaeria pertusa]
MYIYSQGEVKESTPHQQLTHTLVERRQQQIIQYYRLLPVTMTSYLSRSTTTSTDPLSSSTHRAPLWDPRATLQLEHDGRCVGYAPSKGRKCRNIIAGHNLSKANTILHDMARQQPDPEALRSKLWRLAQHHLCIRWHQNQARDMVEKWTDRMIEAYPHASVETRRRSSRGDTISRRDSQLERLESQLDRLLALVAERDSRRSRASVTPSVPSRQRPISSPTPTVSSSASLPDLSGRETFQDTISSMQETVRIAQRRLSVAENTHSPGQRSPSVSRVSTSDISSLHLSRTSTTRSSATAAVSSSPRSITNTTASSSRTCTRAHVRRRAIDDECPICRENFLVGEQLVWCKDSCGRTVHKGCFEQWRAECIADRRRTTCTICRAEWGPDCGCEDRRPARS